MQSQNAKCDECGRIGHFKKCCKKLGNFPNNNSNRQNLSSSTGADRMNLATAVPQLDAEFFDERGIPKTYNLLPAPQIGRMNILRSIPKDDVILISEHGEEIQPQPKQPNNTPSVSGSVPAPDFPFLEFPLTEVINQSQIDSSSISDMLHLRETGNSSKKAPRSTDFPLKSMQNNSSDEEMRETRDPTVSAKPSQSTRDSCTTATPINSNLEKSILGTALLVETNSTMHPQMPTEEQALQALMALQDSIPDTPPKNAHPT